MADAIPRAFTSAQTMSDRRISWAFLVSDRRNAKAPRIWFVSRRLGWQIPVSPIGCVAATSAVRRHLKMNIYSFIPAEAHAVCA